MEKKIFDNIEIEYELPNIPQTLKILARLSDDQISLDSLKDGLKNDEKLILLANIIENLDKVVKKIIIDGTEISFSDSLKDFSMMAPLTVIGTEVLDAMAVSAKKKQA